jgi:hypothetical protein
MTLCHQGLQTWRMRDKNVRGVNDTSARWIILDKGTRYRQLSTWPRQTLSCDVKFCDKQPSFATSLSSHVNVKKVAFSTLYSLTGCMTHVPTCALRSGKRRRWHRPRHFDCNN